MQPRQLHHLHTWPSRGQTQVLQGSLGRKPLWTSHMQRWKKKHNWNPGAVWLSKKTQNLPASCTSCRLNPHNQLGRLCVYGIYKRSLRALVRTSAKENALVLIAVDIGSKNLEEQDQIRIWAAPTTGPGTSTVLEGIIGRWGGLRLPARERTLTAVT